MRVGFSSQPAPFVGSQMARQQHLDRLTSIDASFLHQEGPASHMHIGGVLLFEGPPRRSRTISITSARGCTSCRATARSSRRRRWRPGARCGSTTRASTSSTTSATPRCRLRAAEEQLFLLASRIASQQLDRSKPLWENWLVEGLADGRFAIIFKTHHSLVDGISGVDLATVLFDLERDPAPPAEDLEPWQPQPRAVERRAGRRRRPRDGDDDRRARDQGRRRRDQARDRRSARCATPPRASASSSGRA